MASKSSIIKLYKAMLRESEKFSSYNFRNYALRRTRDAFKENKALTDPEQIQKQVEFAKENLEIIKRQVAISKMYSGGRLVIEHDSNKNILQ